ncbi:hypothetical protein D6829_00730 [Candidatus Pacearchaeota archaeon]|nr:MAG: hypothetical protein D6829_00730 [Candidatus Pacearchaeota archaeon]
MERKIKKAVKLKMSMEKEVQVLALLSALLLILVFSLVSATPTGPDSINVTSNTTKSAAAGYKINISGGYIAKLNITATAQNPHWKAFAGWVTGKFTLDDSTGSTIYDWTLSSVSGEVYATRTSSTPSWSSVRCANSTEIENENTALAHSSPDDNITATFAGVNSNTFVVAGTQITAGSCNATNTYVNNASQNSVFEESILSDTSNIIFVTNIESGGATGYDGNSYDFQMLVPENGSSTWTGAIAYYLYVELG